MKKFMIFVKIEIQFLAGAGSKTLSSGSDKKLSILAHPDPQRRFFFF
jgi:hypothetical protein